MNEDSPTNLYTPPRARCLQVVSPVQTSELALLVTTSCLQHNVVNHFHVTPDGIIDCTADSSGALRMRKFRLLHKARLRRRSTLRPRLC